MKSLFIKIIPALFVIIWASGFVVAEQIKGDIDPVIFLGIRCLLSAIIFFAIGWLLREKFPQLTTTFKLLIIGVLTQGLYLSCSYLAVGKGLPPGIMALIGSLQPPLTAIVASKLYHENINRNIIIGMILGVLGVGFAITPSLNTGDMNANQQGLIGALIGFVALLSMTAGILLQKSSVAKVGLMTSSGIQMTGAVVTDIILVWALGESLILWNTNTLLSLAYAVLILSVAGNSMLLYMVRNGSVTKTTSLLFLVPPVASIQAYFLFGNTLSLLQIIGFTTAIIGVYLSRR